MPEYDPNLQRAGKGQHRVAKDLAARAKELAASKFAAPLYNWATAAPEKRGAEPPAKSEDPPPEEPSLTAILQQQKARMSAHGTPKAHAAPSSAFPALPSQQEFAAALAPAPESPPVAEEYVPLCHGPPSRSHSSTGSATFQFAAGAAQQSHAMQSMGPTVALPSQRGDQMQCPVRSETPEQAAARFLETLGDEPDSAAQASPVLPCHNSEGMQTQLQTASSGPAAAQSDGLGAESQTLAQVIVWRRGQWVGPSPREHLLEWSIKHAVSYRLLPGSLSNMLYVSS